LAAGELSKNLFAVEKFPSKNAKFGAETAILEKFGGKIKILILNTRDLFSVRNLQLRSCHA